VLRCSRAAVDVDSILTYIGDGEGVADCGIVDDHKDFVRAAEGEGKEGAHECEGVDCEHPSHDHSHGHEADGGDCNDPDCSDPSHSHSHSHEAHDGDCNDPDCSDPSHSHSHSHSHSPTHAHGAIGSFVFRSRRPFHPSRLSAFVKSHLSGPSPTALLRAKGFCWMANSHTSALYFAYAGVTFEMQVSPLV
jgi:G3E family GTPase